MKYHVKDLQHLKNSTSITFFPIESFSHDLERTKTKDDTQTNRRGDRSRETQY